MPYTEDDLIEAIELRAANGYAELNRLMIKCLSAISDHLPLLALRSLDAAKQYWVEDSKTIDLQSHRVACWEGLDNNRTKEADSSINNLGMRAIICVLYERPPSDHASDTLEFFVPTIIELFTKVGEREPEKRVADLIGI